MENVALTSSINLNNDDLSHNRCPIELQDCLLGCPCRVEGDAGQPKVLARLRVEADVDLLDGAKFLTHVAQEGFPDIVVEVGDGDLFGRQLPDIVFVILDTRKSNIYMQ